MFSDQELLAIVIEGLIEEGGKLHRQLDRFKLARP